MIKFRLFGLDNNETNPAPQVAGEEDAAPVPEMPQVDFNGKRVLIVDDDPVFLRATSMKLQAEGYQVATAKEGSEAITALSENPVDAVLMDINFPADVCNGGMGSWDGFQVMYWLRGLHGTRGIRFIMVTGSDSDADRAKAQDLGAVAYFQKPLDHAALVEVINGLN